MNELHPRLVDVLRQLHHEVFCSGESIASTLQLSRASVHGLVKQAEALGIAVHAVRGRGYRLARPLDLLDEALLAARLAPMGFHVMCLPEVDSTNARLLHLGEAGAPHRTVLAAEWQTRGRGRRGRSWLGRLGDSLTFSVLWRFTRPVGMLSGLSLAVGVAVVRALGVLGIEGVTLKWPNDLLRAGHKLGGILVELSGDMLGPATAVIGLGLNVRGAEALGGELGMRVADLANDAGPPLDRNALLVALVRELDGVLSQFDQAGFTCFREEWERHHAWAGDPVQVLQPDGHVLTGIATGVDELGTLLLATAAGTQRILSGEVSLRRHGGQP